MFLEDKWKYFLKENKEYGMEKVFMDELSQAR